MKLFDTHAHLDFPKFDKDRDEVMKRAREAGVVNILTVGADINSSSRAVELAESIPGLAAAIGLHPHDASDFTPDTARELKKLAGREAVKALGEIGLDFYYDNSPREQQKQAFRSQLRLAAMLELPVIIHSREAEEDTLKILQEEGAGLAGVVHCYSSSAGMAERLVEFGFHLGFTGLVTFRKLGWLREIVSQTPPEKILLETDCPYMAPEPKRGKRNEPAYVKYVAETAADCLNLSVEQVAELTTANGQQLFALEDYSRLGD